MGIKKPEPIFRVFISYILFLLFYILSEFVLNEFGLLELTSYEFDIKTDLMKIIGMMIITPSAEELLYRGLFKSKLIYLKLNKHFAIFIIATLFVFVHSF